MEKKKILTYHTKSDVIETLQRMLSDSNWEMHYESEIEQFLVALDPDEYNLLIVEANELRDDVREVLDGYELPVIFITNSPEKIANKIVIPENFSLNDLKKGMTKASFLKIDTENKPSINEDDGYSVESGEESEKEDAVLLEPVFEEAGDDEAFILSSNDEEKENIRSSWEIPGKESLETDDNFDTESVVITENKKEEKDENKGSIFDRMDEIDNLIQSLSDDISKEKPFGTHAAMESGHSIENLNEEDGTKDLFDSIDDQETDLFDDDYEFSKEAPAEGDKTIEAETVEFESKSSIVDDFESIMSGDKTIDPEQEWLESEQNSDPIVHEEVEAAPVEEYKKEIHAWLEKNGRKIIKEVIEEQLSKIWEKK